MNRLSQILSKALPWIGYIFIAVAFVATFTNYLGPRVHNLAIKIWSDFGSNVQPLAPYIFLAVVELSLANFMCKPVGNFVMAVLDRRKRDNQTKLTVFRAFQIIWWIVAYASAAMLVFGDSFWKLFISFGTLALALGACWQGQLTSLLSGIAVQFTDHVKAGEQVLEIGGKTFDKPGTVTVVDSLFTRVQVEEVKADKLYVCDISIPNKKIADEIVKRVVSVSEAPPTADAHPAANTTTPEATAPPPLPA